MGTSIHPWTPLEDKDGEPQDEETVVRVAESSITGASFNMCNNIVGAGILTLPYAIRCAGVVPGATLLVVCCALSCFSHMLLVQASHRCQRYSFKEIVIHYCGERAGVTAEWFVLGTTLGFLMGFCCLLADFLTKAFAELLPPGELGVPRWIHLLRCTDERWTEEGTAYDLLTQRAIMLVVVGVFVLFPLSSMRNLNPLRHTSVIALICVLYGVVLSVLRLAQGGIDSSVVPFRASPSFFSAVPLFSGAYSAQYNTLRFYEELRNRSPARMWRVILSSNFCAACLYASMSMAGYLTFGEDVDGNLLNSYGTSDKMAVIARLGLAFTIAFSYPIVLFPTRAGLVRLLLTRHKDLFEKSTTAHLGLTAALVGASVVYAIFVPGVEIVLGFDGAIFCSAVVYGIPGLVGMKLGSARRRLGEEDATWMVVGGWALIGLAVVFGVLGVVTTTLDVINNGS